MNTKSYPVPGERRLRQLFPVGKLLPSLFDLIPEHEKERRSSSTDFGAWQACAQHKESNGLQGQNISAYNVTISSESSAAHLGDAVVAAGCGDEGAVVGKHGERGHTHLTETGVSPLHQGHRLGRALLVADVNDLKKRTAQPRWWSEDALSGNKNNICGSGAEV